MLSCLPHRPSDSNANNEYSGPNITDKTFDVSMINSSKINPILLLKMTIRKQIINALKKSLTCLVMIGNRTSKG